MKKIYEETRLIPLTVVKTCKKGWWVLYDPPLVLKLIKGVGGYIDPPSITKTSK